MNNAEIPRAVLGYAQTILKTGKDTNSGKPDTWVKIPATVIDSQNVSHPAQVAFSLREYDAQDLISGERRQWTYDSASKTSVVTEVFPITDNYQFLVYAFKEDGTPLEIFPPETPNGIWKQTLLSQDRLNAAYISLAQLKNKTGWLILK